MGNMFIKASIRLMNAVISQNAGQFHVAGNMLPMVPKLPTLLIPSEVAGRRISYEYALIAGVNDSPAHAEALAKLLGGQNCHVNLIPCPSPPQTA